MSAYVVENTTIDRVVSLLMQGTEDHRGYLPHPPKCLEIHNRTDAQEIGQMLLDLNYEAVNQRYEEQDPSISYQCENIGNIKRIAGLKSIRCLLYQMSEGNVPEHPLYKALDKWAGKVASYIVSDLPEYEKAPWG